MEIRKNVPNLALLAILNGELSPTSRRPVPIFLGNCRSKKDTGLEKSSKSNVALNIPPWILPVIRKCSICLSHQIYPSLLQHFLSRQRTENCFISNLLSVLLNFIRVDYCFYSPPSSIMATVLESGNAQYKNKWRTIHDNNSKKPINTCIMQGGTTTHGGFLSKTNPLVLIYCNMVRRRKMVVSVVHFQQKRSRFTRAPHPAAPSWVPTLWPCSNVTPKSTKVQYIVCNFGFFWTVHSTVSICP